MSISLINKTLGKASSGDFGYSVFLNNNISIVSSNNLSSTGDLTFQESYKGNWEEKLFVDGAVGLGLYGDIDKNYFITSNFGSDIVYLYKRTKGVWNLVDTITYSENINYGISVSISNNIAVVGANDGGGAAVGIVFIYEIENDSLILKQTLNAEGANERFGSSVSIDKNYLVVSSNSSDGFLSKITIFEKGEKEWFKTVSFNEESLADDYGYSTSINGNYCATLANDYNSGNIKLYIYEKEKNWSLKYTYTESGTVPGTFPLKILAIDKNYLILGLPQHDSSRGKVIIFKKEKEWAINKVILGTTTGDFFGGSVDISNDYFSVGAKEEGTGGASYIYQLKN